MTASELLKGKLTTDPAGIRGKAREARAIRERPAHLTLPGKTSPGASRALQDSRLRFQGGDVSGVRGSASRHRAAVRQCERRGQEDDPSSTVRREPGQRPRDKSD